MTATTYPIRLFGGRSLGVIYDNVAGTLTILNQSISLSSLSTSLQNQWASAVATTSPVAKAAFGGDNVSQAIGSILDATPTWRTAVQSALATFVAMNPIDDPEQFIH
jgi:hypothetical protein